MTPHDQTIPGYVQALDLFDGLPTAIEVRQRSYALLTTGDRPTPGPIADVGCGTGRAVAELAAAGHDAVGVDADPALVALATDRHPGAHFHTGDARELAFADGELSGYRADKLLHQLTEPSAAVAEARRVLRPGGRIVLIGQDFEGLVVDVDDGLIPVGRALIAGQTAAIPSPWVARRFRGLLLAAGFAEVTVEARALVVTDPAVLRAMTAGPLRAGAHVPGAAEWERAVLTRRYPFGLVLLVIAAATRTPGGI